MTFSGEPFRSIKLTVADTQDMLGLISNINTNTSELAGIIFFPEFTKTH